MPPQVMQRDTGALIVALAEEFGTTRGAAVRCATAWYAGFIAGKEDYVEATALRETGIDYEDESRYDN